MDEEWKPIKGLERRYEISDQGEVRSLIKDKVMSTYINNSGYECIDLAIGNGERKKITIHRLVAFHFCAGFNDGLHVNHINADKLDNRAGNLEWVTVKENIEDTLDRGTHDINKAHEVAWTKNKKPVNMLGKDGNYIMSFSSINEAMEETGVVHVSSVVRGRRKYAGGYQWEYSNQDKDIV